MLYPLPLMVRVESGMNTNVHNPGLLFVHLSAAGMRRGEGTSMDDALRGLKLNDEPGEVKIE
jgi:hypothetical protein